MRAKFQTLSFSNHIDYIDPSLPYAEMWVGDHPNGPCYVEKVKINQWLKSEEGEYFQNGNQTEIWLATEHNNFPYKMAITDKGDQFTQVLTQINFE